MWNFYKRKIAQSTAFSLCLGENSKFISDDRGRGNSCGLELYGVVDTPRRARASISKCANDEITVRRQFLEAIGFSPGHLSSGK